MKISNVTDYAALSKDQKGGMGPDSIPLENHKWLEILVRTLLEQLIFEGGPDSVKYFDD